MTFRRRIAHWCVGFRALVGGAPTWEPEPFPWALPRNAQAVSVAFRCGIPPFAGCAFALAVSVETVPFARVGSYVRREGGGSPKSFYLVWTSLLNLTHQHLGDTQVDELDQGVGGGWILLRQVERYHLVPSDDAGG